MVFSIVANMRKLNLPMDVSLCSVIASGERFAVLSEMSPLPGCQLVSHLLFELERKGFLQILTVFSMVRDKLVRCFLST